MGNRRDLDSILKRARKVHTSLHNRRPAHWTGAQADHAESLMSKAIDNLELAYEYYAQLEEAAHGRRKPVLMHSTGGMS